MLQNSKSEVSASVLSKDLPIIISGDLRQTIVNGNFCITVSKENLLNKEDLFDVLFASISDDLTLTNYRLFIIKEYLKLNKLEVVPSDKVAKENKFDILALSKSLFKQIVRFAKWLRK